MEYQKPSSTTKPKNKILKFLPRATSSVSFRNPQLYSPVKDKKPCDKPNKSNLGIGFSGPMISIVPSSQKIKNLNDPTFTLVYEPTSPRVSCMGQVKCKHYGKHASNKLSKATSFNVNTPVKSTCEEDQDQKVTKGKKKLGFKGLLFRGGSRKRGAETKPNTVALTLPRAPSLGKMKRFSSGRDVFTNFDWTTQVTPYTDDERDGGSDGEEVRVPASAPVMERNYKGVGDEFVRVGGVKLEPRKEINLWKRRTMAQPKPLQLHVSN